MSQIQLLKIVSLGILATAWGWILPAPTNGGLKLWGSAPSRVSFLTMLALVVFLVLILLS